MSLFRSLGLYGQIAAGVAVLGVVGAIGLGLRDYKAARGERTAYHACQASAAGRKGPAAPGEACAKPIALAIDQARAASACASGLRPAKAGDWFVPNVCPSAVQDLALAASSAAANVRARDQTILSLRADRNAAISRAEARAAADMRRQNDVTTALNRAVRSDDGRLVCSDECLRGLVGE